MVAALTLDVSCCFIAFLPCKMLDSVISVQLIPSKAAASHCSPFAPLFQQHKEFCEVVRLRPDPIESSSQGNALARAKSLAPAERVGDPDGALGYEANLFDRVILDLDVARVAGPDTRRELSAPVRVVSTAERN